MGPVPELGAGGTKGTEEVPWNGWEHFFPVSEKPRLPRGAVGSFPSLEIARNHLDMILGSQGAWARCSSHLNPSDPGTNCQD